MATQIIAIANQKGGVGKTATAANLAASFAEIGKKTLLIDLDYQGNATSYFGLKFKAKHQDKSASAGLGDGVSLADCIMKTDSPQLDVVPGDMGLSKLSREKILDPGAALLLKKWLDCPVAKTYDVILIDTHPSLDLLFQMAMTAAHHYLVPMFAEADPFDGLKYMFSELGQIKSGLNPSLYFLGLVITKYDDTNATHNKFLALLKKFSKSNSINICGIIPDSKAIASSSSVQKPLLWYLPNLPVTKAYLKLGKDLGKDLSVKRIGKKQKVPVIKDTPTEFMEIFGESHNAEIF